MKIKCDCEGHTIEISYISRPDTIPPCISIAIYDLYGKAEKPLKKPKLLADVVLTNNKFKSLDKFFRAVDKIKRSIVIKKSSKNTTKNRRK